MRVPFLSKAVQPFMRELHLWVLRSKFGGRRIRGHGWRGVAIGASRALAEQITHDLELAYDATTAALTAELGPPTHHGSPIHILYCRSPQEVRSISAALCGRCLTDDPTLGGVYLPERAMVLVSGDPGSAESLQTAAHELCHILVSLAYGGRTYIPWASEGLAELVAEAVLEQRRSADVGRRSFVLFRKYRRSGMCISLKDMLMLADPYAFHPGRCNWAFHAYSVVFISFLNQRAANNHRIKEVFLAAAIGNAESVEEVLARVEEAFGKPVDQIEREFSKYVEFEDALLEYGDLEVYRHLRVRYFRDRSCN